MKFLTLIKNGSVYSPNFLGEKNILCDSERILKIGDITEKSLDPLGLDYNVIEAQGKIISPGFIDPHAHFLGGSGENGGFSSQTPEIFLSEFTLNGITTAVGTLGSDTTMKTMAGLLAKAKAYKEEGMSAYIYTGGYSIPPTSIMPSARQDIMFIEEVIGIGEVAIADERSDEPSIRELARTVTDGFKAGMLAKKAGVTHFHVGPGKRRMKCIEDLLESESEIDPTWIYATHIERSLKLIEAAVRLARKGIFVDMDMADRKLDQYLKIFLNAGGPLEQLSISSDTCNTSPRNIIEEIRRCVFTKAFQLEDLLPLLTRNPAHFLKLQGKGEIKVGYDASFTILDEKSLEIVDVISKGKIMVKDGRKVVKEKFLEKCNRDMSIVGSLYDKEQKSPDIY